MVQKLVAAFGRHIDHLAWIAPETRARAKANRPRRVSDEATDLNASTWRSNGPDGSPMQQPASEHGGEAHAEGTALEWMRMDVGHPRGGFSRQTGFVVVVDVTDVGVGEVEGIGGQRVALR